MCMVVFECVLCNLYFTFLTQKFSYYIYFSELAVIYSGDFAHGPMAKNLLCNPGDSGSIPGWGTKIPHAPGKLCRQTSTPEPCALGSWRCNREASMAAKSPRGDKDPVQPKLK